MMVHILDTTRTIPYLCPPIISNQSRRPNIRVCLLSLRLHDITRPREFTGTLKTECKEHNPSSKSLTGTEMWRQKQSQCKPLRRLELEMGHQLSCQPGTKVVKRLLKSIRTIFVSLEISRFGGEGL